MLIAVGKTQEIYCGGNYHHINHTAVEEIQKKYNLIYADPPWNYSDVRGGKIMHGGIGRHYKTLKTEEICKLPIKDLADEDCLLFIWATMPNLPEVFKVITAWGFKYSTIGFTWVKLNSQNMKPFFGIGNYTKSNAELCFIATRGKTLKFKKSNKISSIILSKRREHSRKPDEARRRIELLFGNIPKIELFARQKFEGWDCWGNEVPKEVQKVLL